MHGQGFAEGAGLAHEHAAALTQGTVNGFDDVGPALARGTGSVLLARQHLGVDFPLVGKIPAVAMIPAGQRRPELAQRGFAPAAQHPAHDAPPGAFDDAPQPDLAPFVAYKAAQLIGFQDFPLLALRLFRA